MSSGCARVYRRQYCADLRAFGHGIPRRYRRAGASGGRTIYAPGISDNGTGLAALLAIARSLRDARIRTSSSILFSANVGEEGEGNLRGMRKLVTTYRKRLRYVIALDGSSTDYITTAALASRRVEITVNGPGGHSWSDFGAPNPIHALARGIARFVRRRCPKTRAPVSTWEKSKAGPRSIRFRRKP